MIVRRRSYGSRSCFGSAIDAATVWRSVLPEKSSKPLYLQDKAAYIQQVLKPLQEGRNRFM